jgi:uncharacterized protein YbjT (DUF2867 family)
MTVLVTGATGTNGLEVVRQTLGRGGRVRAFVRDGQSARAVLPPEVEIFEGDFAQRASALRAMQGVERLFLLSPVHERMSEFELGFIDAAREARVAQVVQFSAVGANPASKAFFPRAHGRAEVALADSGLAYTILQPTFFMQNTLWSADSIKREGTIYNATGAGESAHVDARDIAAVAAAALTEPIERHAGEIYLITGPERLTWAEIAERFSRVLGRPVRHVNVPDDAYRDSMIRQGGMPSWQAQAVLELEVHCRGGDFSALTDVVERVGGRRPGTIDDFIRQHAASFGG